MVPLQVPWLLLCTPGSCAALVAASASVPGDVGEGGSFQEITRALCADGGSGTTVHHWWSCTLVDGVRQGKHPASCYNPRCSCLALPCCKVWSSVEVRL